MQLWNLYFYNYEQIIIQIIVKDSCSLTKCDNAINLLCVFYP